jgi:histidinol-phosphate phosphatase family protein
LLKRAVFIDKDGTLVDDIPYNVDPALVRFSTGAFDALRQLQERGFAPIVVTNQPGIALNLFDREALASLERHLVKTLAAEGISLAGFFACTHAPAGSSVQNCLCRKPAPGLLLQAARVHRLDLSQCWMVGDILDDVEAGRRAGCRTVLLDVGHETIWRNTPMRRPDFTASDLLTAAAFIAANS